ncbi:MAG: tetratricopeptide repeat protein [Egibacteraceae bacterium]
MARAFAAAGNALEGGDVDRATELLIWAKSAAARSAVIREALGVARYLAGDFVGANRELLAYRRLSGRKDQNHLLADCARAAGQSEKVAEYVDEMMRAGVAPDRVAEGLLVLAGERADRGDLRGSLSALERADLNSCRIQPWHPRLWYFAGDLHEQLGDLDRARDYFEAITAVEEDFFDAKDRLAALSTDGERDQRPD